MILLDAKAEIDSRLTEAMRADYQKQIPEYFEALEMASKALEAQMRLMTIIDDLDASPITKDDTFSYMAMMETLDECRWDWEEDE